MIQDNNDEFEKNEMYRTIGKFIIDLQVMQYQVRVILFTLYKMWVKIEPTVDGEWVINDKWNQIIKKWEKSWEKYQKATIDDPDKQVYNEGFWAFILNDDSITNSDANKVFYKLITQYIKTSKNSNLQFSSKDYEFLKKSTNYRNDIAHGYFLHDKNRTKGPNLWTSHRINRCLSVEKNKVLMNEIMLEIDDIIQQLDMKHADSISRKLGAIQSHINKHS